MSEINILHKRSKKIVQTFAAFMVATSAQASFELALISDSTDDVVHKFNTYTGLYQGSFGMGLLVNPIGLAIDQSVNLAYVLDAGNSVVKFNYNTGAFAGSFSVTAGATKLVRNSDGTLNLVYGANVQRRNTAGTLLTTYTHATGHNAVNGILGPDGLFYVPSRTGDTRVLAWHNYATGAKISQTTWLADNLVRLSGFEMFNVFKDGAGGGTTFFERNVFNNGPGASGGEFSTPAILDPTGAAVGHGRMGYGVGTKGGAPGVGIVQRFDMNTDTFRGTFGDGILNTPTGMAIVVAPEPGSLIALGIGGFLLLRRKSKCEDSSKN